MSTTTISPAEKTIAEHIPTFEKWHANQNPRTRGNDLKILQLLASENTAVSKLTPKKIEEIASRYQAYEPEKKTRKGRIKNVLDKLKKAYNAEVFGLAYNPTTKKTKKVEPEPVQEPEENHAGVSLEDILSTPGQVEPITIEPVTEIHRSIVRTFNQLYEIRNNPNDELYKLLLGHFKKLVAKEAAQLGA